MEHECQQCIGAIHSGEYQDVRDDCVVEEGKDNNIALVPPLIGIVCSVNICALVKDCGGQKEFIALDYKTISCRKQILNCLSEHFCIHTVLNKVKI